MLVTGFEQDKKVFDRTGAGARVVFTGFKQDKEVLMGLELGQE